jgi:hypothetical protein
MSVQYALRAYASWGGLDDFEIQCLDTDQNRTCSTISHPPPKEFIDRFLKNDLSKIDAKIRYQRFCSSTPVCVNAELSYKDSAGKEHSARFITYIRLDPQEFGKRCF